MYALLLIGVLLAQGQPQPTPRPATGGVVSGRVVYADGAPVTGSIVTMVPVSQPASTPPPRITFTNQAGEFRASSLPPGLYYVRLGTTRDAPMFYPGVTSERAATAVTITADANVENLNFALPIGAAVRVSGHVTFPANQSTRQPAQRVQLSLNDQVGSPIAADGTFDIPHVRPGSYALTVSLAPGFQPVPIVVSDRDLMGVELVVPRLTPIAGTVALEGGGTRPRFTVVIEGTTYRTNVAVTPDGVFATELPEGEYIVRLTGLPAGYYLKSLATDKVDLFVNRLRIGSAESIPVKVTFGRSAGVTISGRVNISTPAKSIQLTARSVDQSQDSPLEPDGSFKLEKVMPGAYVARVTLASNLVSPLVPVDVPNKDVRDLEIAVPGEKEIFGRVTVDGYGPPPKFTLLLVSGADADLGAVKAGEIPSLSTTARFALTRGAGSEGTQALQINVNALPDGSFRMKLPEGNYRIAAGNPLQPAYVLQEATYGSADLFKEPMVVSARPAELHFGFGTTAPNPWVKVGGKVVGGDPAKGPFRVALEGRTTSTIETVVNQDGSFEFPRVLKDSTYTARLVPANDAASAPAINVTDKDVSGVQILVPSEKEIRIVATVDDGVVPSFVMSFAGSGSTVNVLVKPERDGSFRAKVPTDERRIRVSGFPLGYVVKSMSFGLTDVLKQPLKIAGDDSSELRVVFGSDPALPSGSVKGQVVGLAPDHSDVRIVFNDVTAFSTYETSVSPDGTFSFSKLPQGTYVPSLLGADVSGLLSPSTVVVTGSDGFPIQLTAPNQTRRIPPPSVDDGPTGVVVSNLGGGSREAANESAAVAQLRTINTALITYLSANGGKYGNIADLVKAGLLDARFNGVISGFSFSIIAAGTTYAAAAIPASQGSGRYGYYAMPDAVIHYVTLESLAPPRQGGNVVQ